MSNGESGPPVPLWQHVKNLQEQAKALAERFQSDQKMIDSLYQRIRALEAALANRVLALADAPDRPEGSLPKGVRGE